MTEIGRCPWQSAYSDKQGWKHAWLPEEEQKFRQMWSDGLSTDVIAERLGRSKNSVCSKRKTLKLPARGRESMGRGGLQQSLKQAERSIKFARMAKSKKAATKAAQVIKPRNFSFRKIPGAAQAPSAIAELPRVAPEGAVSMADAGLSHCRYPVAAPEIIRVDVPLFCGKKAVLGKSWCAEHHARVFEKPKHGVRPAWR